MHDDLDELDKLGRASSRLSIVVETMLAAPLDSGEFENACRLRPARTAPRWCVNFS
jgi:hypothetical protein